MSVLTDPIADFLTRFKNATRAQKEEFHAPFSKIKADIARILKEEGYIWSYEIDTDGKYPEIVVKPRYRKLASGSSITRTDGTGREPMFLPS